MDALKHTHTHTHTQPAMVTPSLIARRPTQTHTQAGKALEETHTTHTQISRYTHTPSHKPAAAAELDDFLKRGLESLFAAREGA
jgi:hypothetical protein